jgi:hypothetical protein
LIDLPYLTVVPDTYKTIKTSCCKRIASEPYGTNLVAGSVDHINQPIFLTVKVTSDESVAGWIAEHLGEEPLLELRV